MNLSLILNMTPGSAPASPANANAVQGQIPAEMASFQDFLSLMGLPAMAIGAAPELAEGDAAVIDPATLAAMTGSETGNLLPPALPVLPVLPDAAARSVDPALVLPMPVVAAPAVLVSATADQVARPQAQPAPAMPLAAQPQSAAMPLLVPDSFVTTGLPVPPEALAGAVANAVTPSQPARLQPAIAQANIAFDVPLAATQPQPAVPPQAAAQQATAQPVLAQLLQSAARPAARKGADEAIAAPIATAVSGHSAEASRPAASAPVLPLTTAAVTSVTPEAAAPQPAATSAPTPAATAERHDFTAVIDRLAEARELARPGRADMHLAHREFGQVSVQFELAGQALKVAMTSADPGFAPAVQQALADRPVAATGDAVRAESQPQRGDSVTASTPSWQAGPQADSQRQDGQSRTQQARTGNGPMHGNDAEADSSGGTASDRDGSRFA